MFINMLGINIESYGHVPYPLGLFLSFGKNKFFHKLKLIFNSLIGKIEIVIKVWLGISFGHGGAHFLTRSTRLTQKPTFPKF